MDATIQQLTGATILKATRDGVWLDLETSKGRILIGAKSVCAALHCVSCGEERLVEVVQTAGVDEAFCAVCARSWKLDGR